MSSKLAGLSIRVLLETCPLVLFSPKNVGAVDLLPFQGFARRSGIQVFRLYSRPSSVTDGNGGL